MQVLGPNTLLLMDAGCERFGFASDVTRTWPIGGRFTAPQRAVYDAVAEVHTKCLAAIEPGAWWCTHCGLTMLMFDHVNYRGDHA